LHVNGIVIILLFPFVLRFQSGLQKDVIRYTAIQYDRKLALNKFSN